MCNPIVYCGCFPISCKRPLKCKRVYIPAHFEPWNFELYFTIGIIFGYLYDMNDTSLSRLDCCMSIRDNNAVLLVLVGQASMDKNSWTSAVTADLRTISSWSEVDKYVGYTTAQWMEYLREHGRPFVQKLKRYICSEECIKKICGTVSRKNQ